MRWRFALAVCVASSLGAICAAAKQPLPPTRYKFDAVIEGTGSTTRIVHLASESTATRRTWQVFPGESILAAVPNRPKETAICGPFYPGITGPAVKIMDQIIVIEPDSLVLKQSDNRRVPVPVGAKNIAFEEKNQAIEVFVDGKSILRIQR